MIPVCCLSPDSRWKMADVETLGGFCAASIPVVGFNAILMSEHFGSFLVFGVLHAALMIKYVKVCLPPILCQQLIVYAVTNRSSRIFPASWFVVKQCLEALSKRPYRVFVDRKFSSTCCSGCHHQGTPK